MQGYRFNKEQMRTN